MIFLHMEENSSFYVAENIYVHVDINELNDILSTTGHTKVDETE
jgi:hypothetical protein